MKHITVHKVVIRDDDTFSNGIGFDDQGEVVEFRGFTGTMRNIRDAIEDYEDDNSLGRPSIYLESWQLDKETE